ncbi:vesicle-fusing ATPase-like isoform X2 [Convolutriloba macropyga]|uniref:vesicle-fusing ATPase-like isoform X2 n=1 Tax=Convolutriloba macropyga TaxID=536237 RepID=UPI003F5242BF
MVQLTVDKAPANDPDFPFTNLVAVSPEDFLEKDQHVKVTSESGRMFHVFSIRRMPEVNRGSICFNTGQRQFASLGAGQKVDVEVYRFEQNEYVTAISLKTDFISKKTAPSDRPFDTDKMAREFCMQFQNQAMQLGQTIFFKFNDSKLLLSVVEISGGGAKSFLKTLSKPKSLDRGLFLSNAVATFDRADGSSIMLTGKSKGKASQHTSIINPDWDFQKMGIGGLDDEFSAIFRRAFASRVFPPDVVQQLGHKHVRGILLYGPPGTGKTLMARQIGKMLNAREPKIINGPEILNKFVGQSEENVRKLFEDAEEEQKRCGINSGLHIIIFDEIDAICKERGSTGGGTGVHDTVVNQLLSKMDGVNQLNNILVIGMTNRKDLIDDALLRPGRLEVQTEISLPDEKGRHQIFEIYVQRMRDFQKLADDVDTKELAALTKNFSGAEIEGLVRAAQSTALNRLIKGGVGALQDGNKKKDPAKAAGGKIELDADAADKIKICREDFMLALENDIKPAFGYNSETLKESIPNGIIPWGLSVNRVLEDGRLMFKQVKESEATPIVTFLIQGPPNCGKTALGAHLALESDFPFAKIISPANMIGMTELAKCHAIKKIFFDAYKSSLSVVVVDEIESLIDYVPMCPGKFSNMVLQALIALVKKVPPKGKRLLVIGTTSRKDVLDDMGLLSAFNSSFHLSNITKGEEVVTVVKHMGCFTDQEVSQIERKISGLTCFVGIKKLIVLAEGARHSTSDRVNTFLCHLEEEAGLETKVPFERIDNPQEIGNMYNRGEDAKNLPASDNQKVQADDEDYNQGYNYVNDHSIYSPTVRTDSKRSQSKGQKNADRKSTRTKSKTPTRKSAEPSKSRDVSKSPTSSKRK